jgi:hypothetical protein
VNETGRLSRKQEKAIVAFVSSKTIDDAAKSSGVGRTTLFKWLQDDTFQDAYRRARTKIVQQAIAKMQNASGLAVSVLEEIMSDKDSPPSTRVNAAKAVLETSLKAVELEDILRRIERIEAHVNSRNERQ